MRRPRVQRTSRPTRLAEEQLGGGVGGEHADPQPGDVDALGHHAHRDDPRVARCREAGDAGRGHRVVRRGDRGPDPEPPFEQVGDGAGVLDVHGDDQPGGVGLGPPDLEQAPMGVAEHRGEPLAVGRQRRAQPLVGPDPVELVVEVVLVELARRARPTPSGP